jgi:hypothetical protein
MFKFIHRYFRGRWERYYLKSHWHLVLDLSLLIIILILAACLWGFYIYHPNIIFGNYTRPAVDLNNPPLTLDWSVASSTITLAQGDQLKISYKNDGSTTISNLVIDLMSVDNNFSLDKVTLNPGNQAATGQGREVVVAAIPAGADGIVTAQVYFTAKNQASRTIHWQAQAEYTVSGQLLKTAANLPDINLAVPFSIKDEAYYTSLQGDQLGAGPIPPVAGLPTSYWIFWSASSTANFKNIVVSARLPKGVELGSGRSLLAGDFNYSTSTRQLIWRVQDLQGGSDSYRVGFEVRIVPTSQQVGTILPLLDILQYYGVDSLTGDPVSGQIKPVTTNLDNDRFNAGQGQVVSQ